MLMKMNDWNCSVQHLTYPAWEWVNNGNKDLKYEYQAFGKSIKTMDLFVKPW